MGVRKLFQTAVTAHREALRRLERARALGDGPGHGVIDRHRALISQLAQAGTVVTPGWLGQALSRAVDETPLGEADTGAAVAVRIGECVAAQDLSFPVVVNLLGTGHLAVDRGADHPAVQGLIADVLIRLLAARPSQTLGVWSIVTDGSAALSSLAPLVDAGILGPTARASAEVGDVLDEAESHVAQAERSGRRAADLPERVLIGAFGKTDEAVRYRIARLAPRAAAARLHLVLAGWRDHGPASPLPQTTYVTVGRTTRVAGVPLPVTLDAPTDPAVISRVCERLIADAAQWTIP